MATSTNPAAPGMSTSEGKFTLAAQVTGFLLATFGALLTKYAAANPQNIWAGAAVSAMGVVLMLCTHYGYVKGRAIVKNAMLQSTIDWAAPEVEAALEALLAKKLQQAGSSSSSSAQALTAEPPTPHSGPLLRPAVPTPSPVTVAAPFTPPTSPR
jgi:hypothetical protein